MKTLKHHNDIPLTKMNILISLLAIFMNKIKIDDFFYLPFVISHEPLSPLKPNDQNVSKMKFRAKLCNFQIREIKIDIEHNLKAKKPDTFFF